MADSELAEAVQEKSDGSPVGEETESAVSPNDAVSGESSENAKQEVSKSNENEGAETEVQKKNEVASDEEDKEGKEEPEEVKEHVDAQQKDSTDQMDGKDQSPQEIPPCTAEPETTAVASESDVVQTSAQSHSENNSAAGTVEQNKSNKIGEVLTSGPDTSETMSGQTEDVKRPVTEPAYVTKKKKDKKSKRRSRHNSEPAVPKLSRRSSKANSVTNPTSLGGKGCLEAIIVSAFQHSDTDGTGHVKGSAFWEILQSTLALQSDEIATLQGQVLPDKAGLISYAEFASQATELLASLYVGQPSSEKDWVELQMSDGTLFINYNKKTGEAMDKTQVGSDFFTGIIDDLYGRADKDENGCVSWEMFLQLLQSAEMSPYLGTPDFEDMYEYYTGFPDGKASYNEFFGLVREAILRVYRAKDLSESPWCKVSSAEVGEVWFNKYTVESYQGIQVEGREKELEFLTQAYAHVEQTSFELEQYKEHNRQLANQLALSTEDQETLEAQLYETGHALDQANHEIIEKENEVQLLNEVITSKDRDIDALKGTLMELDATKQKMQELENDLQRARETIADRDSSITDRDTNVMTLQKKAESVHDTLKNAQGKMDARDSTIARLEHQLKVEQKKLKDYEELVPDLEEKLSATSSQLNTTKRSLDEKTSALHLARKHLKTARERNMEMDKDVEKIGQVHEKLRSMDSEIRTLKTFLTTKTAMIEKHKKEIREEKQRVTELEEKDRRRAVILADVLEKTARQYQQHLGSKSSHKTLSPSKSYASEQQGETDESRPYSAPAIPPEVSPITDQPDYPSPRMVKTFTTDTHGPVITYSKIQEHQKFQVREPVRGRIKARSHTVPKLPPIHVPGLKQQRTKTFVFPTRHDLKKQHKLRDATLLDHCPSNPYCLCEMCTMNSTVVGQPKQYRPETGLTGMTARTAGLHGYQGETDVRELALSQQLYIGQRVVVRMKKSEFDLEPTKLTGVVRYVGKIDSEFVDHRFYVGVKLDEAAGDTDGLIKNKRYFTCPPRHGKFVRINNVVAVLPNQGVKYKSLHDISKRSPYSTGPSQKAQKNPSDISVS